MSKDSPQQVSTADQIIVVMGPTGAGKSTFIERATGQDGQTVGHGWQSCTAEIRSVRFIHPTGGYPVIFVDTPGFDDTYKSDIDILGMIAEWLVKTYKGKFNLATILYLHRISDNRMSGSAMKNLRLFSSLCGQIAMPHVRIVTTMWCYVPKELGDRRQEELKGEVWKEMLDGGCSVQDFENTRESAWRVIDSLQNGPAQVQLPNEIVVDHLRLNETAAGIALNHELEKLIKAQKDAARRIDEQAGTQGNKLAVHALNAQKAEIEEKILKTVDQLREMKIPFTRRVRLFFKGKR